MGWCRAELQGRALLAKSYSSLRFIYKFNLLSKNPPPPQTEQAAQPQRVPSCYCEEQLDTQLWVHWLHSTGPGQAGSGQSGEHWSNSLKGEQGATAVQGGSCRWTAQGAGVAVCAPHGSCVSSPCAWGQCREQGQALACLGVGTG